MKHQTIITLTLLSLLTLTGCTIQTVCPNPPEQGGAGGEGGEASTSVETVSSTSSGNIQDVCASLSASEGRQACGKHGSVDCGQCVGGGEYCGGPNADPMTLEFSDSDPGYCGGACVPFTPDLVGGAPDPYCPANTHPLACGSSLNLPGCKKEYYAPLDGFYMCCPDEPNCTPFPETPNACAPDAIALECKTPPPGCSSFGSKDAFYYCCPTSEG